MFLVFSFEVKFKVLVNQEFQLIEYWLIELAALSFGGLCLFMDRICKELAGHHEVLVSSTFVLREGNGHQEVLVSSTFVLREGNRYRFPRRENHPETMKASGLREIQVRQSLTRSRSNFF